MKTTRLKQNLIYVSAITLICFAVLFFVYKMWAFDFNVPITYINDGYLTMYSFKAVKDGFLIFENYMIGAPLGNTMYDFNVSYDILNYVFIWLLTLIMPASVAMNVFYFLLFPAGAIVCFFVLKHFGINNFIAAVVSILFTMLPYRFMRNQMHLFLSAYTFIPVIIMLALWLFRDDTFFRVDKHFFKNKKNIFALCILPVIALTGIYYTFYMVLIFGFFMVLKFCLNKFNFRLLLPFIYAISYTGIFCIVASLPSLIYSFYHGWNLIPRLTEDTETLSLNLLRLLVSRGVALALNANFLYLNASDEISEFLGLAGIIGFLFLIFVLFKRSGFKKSELSILVTLSMLNLFLIFYGIKGGLGTMFSILVTPMIRANSRLSIFIAFLSLFTVAVLLQYAFEKFKIKHIKIIITALAAVSLITQVPAPHTQEYNAQYYSDRKFIQSIESELSSGDMVYQMPHVVFPENGYQLLKGYLHSTDLRWSFGAFEGRAGADLQLYLSQLDADNLLKALSLLGYTGIYLDSNLIDYSMMQTMLPELHEDEEDYIFTELLDYFEDKLQRQSITNDSQTIYFINMENYNNATRELYTEAQISRIRQSILKLTWDSV